MNVVEIIQIMLVPGLMVSGCGLLLLSQNNKYSNVINRVRFLDDEKRKLQHQLEEEKLSEIFIKRMNSIKMQIEMLAKRVQYVRNTVLAYTVAVGFFILTCLSVGLQVALPAHDLSKLILIVFLAGMACILIGVVFGVMEAAIGFKIIKIEMNNDDNN